MFKINLKQDFVLIKETPPKEGAFFTEEAQEFTGTVVNVSPIVEGISIGDVVFYEEYDHSKVIILGEKFIKCRVDAIICNVTQE
jgi:hypothetical protein